MVFLLVVLTVAIFLVVDFLLRREEKEIIEICEKIKSPLFLSPEKSLTPISEDDGRLYHQSHSWAQSSDDGMIYVGFDNFISILFSEHIKMDDLPLVGSHIPQGTKVWDVGIDDHKIVQLSPVSGKVVEVNPACKLNIPIPSEKVEKSWILKIAADNLENDENNLMQRSQAEILNNALNDELLMSAQRRKFLNDGGKIDPGFIAQMSDDDWNRIVNQFFPHQAKRKL